MRLLLDDPRLRPAVRSAMQEAEALYVSAVTIWEIAVKRAIGKLQAPDDLPDVILRAGVLPLPSTWDHGAAAGALPPHHGDPLLIAQLRLATQDRAFRRSDVELL